MNRGNKPYSRSRDDTNRMNKPYRSKDDTNRMNRPYSRQVLLGGFVCPTFRSVLQGKGLVLSSLFPAFPNAAAARGHRGGSQHARVWSRAEEPR